MASWVLVYLETSVFIPTEWMLWWREQPAQPPITLHYITNCSTYKLHQEPRVAALLIVVVLNHVDGRSDRNRSCWSFWVWTSSWPHFINQQEVGAVGRTCQLVWMLCCSAGLVKVIVMTRHCAKQTSAALKKNILPGGVSICSKAININMMTMGRLWWSVT